MLQLLLWSIVAQHCFSQHYATLLRVLHAQPMRTRCTLCARASSHVNCPLLPMLLCMLLCLLLLLQSPNHETRIRGM